MDVSGDDAWARVRKAVSVDFGRDRRHRRVHRPRSLHRLLTRATRSGRASTAAIAQPALAATRAALEAGIVSGGGPALAQAHRARADLDLPGDEAREPRSSGYFGRRRGQLVLGASGFG